jgi:hypothetical protein
MQLPIQAGRHNRLTTRLAGWPTAGHVKDRPSFDVDVDFGCDPYGAERCKWNVGGVEDDTGRCCVAGDSCVVDTFRRKHVMRPRDLFDVVECKCNGAPRKVIATGFV